MLERFCITYGVGRRNLYKVASHTKHFPKEVIYHAKERTNFKERRIKGFKDSEQSEKHGGTEERCSFGPYSKAEP